MLTLNVYGIYPYNDYLMWIGLGYYHAGIVYNGREHTFGGYDGGRTYEMPSREIEKEYPHLRFVTSFSAPCNIDDPQAEIDKIRTIFDGLRYDVVGCNCNDFTDGVLETLTGYQTPSWVNRPARIARCIKRWTGYDLGRWFS